MNPIVETYQHEAIEEPETKQERTENAVASKGWLWRVRIVDARNGEVLFQSGHAYKRRDYADRHGQRLIKRFNKTGSWVGGPGVSHE